ncbi:tripartite tricarboxylate transporter substrate binding protein [Bordetella sp. FB-8]|uniref:Bug family tripartite tricarboxylate transporter substrate binding protein n=1 Tax=Bordetella sp. FB-8 TaxID=1159870 RepID=UPI00035D105B|nr:tripartite tricarboxylate transporter substrate binding protein [Bordetella sp. FB-8]
MNIHRRIALGAFLAAAVLGTSTAQAAWPNDKPITYVVPFTPGGSTDVVGRMIAQKLSKILNQNIIVENRAGAGGSIGAAYVAHSAPDGYTLFGGTINTNAINYSLYKNLQYGPKDFEPVSLVATLPNVLLAAPNIGVNSVADLIALLKRDPARRTFASSGVGTSTHLTGELFAATIGVPLTHIPYKGTPPAMVDVSSGAVTFMFDQMTAALPLLQSGKLKLLAVTTAKRMPMSPDTPTLGESGLPGFDVSSWQAVFVPKGTPKPIVDRLSKAIAEIVRQPDVQEKLGKTMGMNLVGSTPEQLQALVDKEIPRWAGVVKRAKLVAQ